ncbi:metallophosphoesterase [Campylobacter sp. VicNov18]|uniref:metallophosphoesterase n=1 Tax=Campylobacter bilis TaxID=2691918 RepID=UPI00130DB7F0|nr:metallophosphoesterase [Campylobacter bilis]MPV63548.1 metallophosphoesterase [Campylobacter hepaticus]MBM0637048.1 metallophosphoesterase [Campylobacter bilis]MCC8277794.1 metallophosphoesterase [Campylobacter bilis]MCC8299403.1 metallophosphoesterase [Campylobacter bilis]MCC8300703.1 metallophosphoesterase [Campylobacter bilis]
MMFLIFSFTVLLIFGLANVYIYKRLIKKIVFFKYLYKFFAFVFILLFLAQALFLIFRKDEYLSDMWYESLAMLYAPTYVLFFVTLGLDFIKLILAFKGKIYEKGNIFWRLFLEFGLLILAGFLIYSSINNALKIPEIRNVDIKIANLKQDLKIALLTDIHLGKNLHEDFLKKLIAKVNLEKPDMVVIVGDLVDTDPKKLGYISKINDFNSTYGTFYALGNHEYYHGVNQVLALLKKHTNMKILVNENLDLGDINIAAIADLEGLKKGVLAPDLARIKLYLNTSKPSILLTHQPKAALLYDLSNFDLILSGHTHAGQIFPFMFIVKLEQGFIHGLYKLGEKTKLYVSSGAGFWGPSLRVLASSEIAILDLKGEK